MVATAVGIAGREADSPSIFAPSCHCTRVVPPGGPPTGLVADSALALADNRLGAACESAEPSSPGATTETSLVRGAVAETRLPRGAVAETPVSPGAAREITLLGWKNSAETWLKFAGASSGQPMPMRILFRCMRSLCGPGAERNQPISWFAVSGKACRSRGPQTRPFMALRKVFASGPSRSQPAASRSKPFVLSSCLIFSGGFTCPGLKSAGTSSFEAAARTEYIGLTFPLTSISRSIR
mmetsp:Transcript_9677/g.28636  ORF Transcript_9677/g.28636 Transcript_9677/m.28636 type:complete len:239 (+) Transcript_9677:333-1049(+)